MKSQKRFITYIFIAYAIGIALGLIANQAMKSITPGTAQAAGGKVMDPKGTAPDRYVYYSGTEPLKDHGRVEMLKKVGVNATGLPYNSIIASDVRAPTAENPKALQNLMVSAGAIATASLIKGATEEKK